jgi:hypothetical protein
MVSGMFVEAKGGGVMRALVINCSSGHYNLGARKLANWLRSEGHTVVEAGTDIPDLLLCGFDLVALSVIFSWHAPAARAIALLVKGQSEVWCGGPGMARLKKWWREETGLDCTVGLDPRFERQHGDYRMTFASRGCPVGCWFCIVPKIEGLTFTLYRDFTPAPVLCDNNLSALPVEFQEHIIRRYRETGTRLLDANSGFEPKAFDEGTYGRWKAVIRGKAPWRLAFDETGEAEDVRRMLGILRPVSASLKRVYVLIGNEPIEACLDRVLQVIDWGGEPYCQPVVLLDALTKTPWVRHDWTVTLLRDFARYVNRHLWRKLPFWEYRPRNGEPAPFAHLAGATV